MHWLFYRKQAKQQLKTKQKMLFIDLFGEEIWDKNFKYTFNHHVIFLAIIHTVHAQLYAVDYQ